MNRSLKIILPIVFLVVACLLALGLIVARPDAPVATPETPSVLVQAFTAERAPVVFSIHSQGTVTPRTQTTLVAEASGQIISVSPDYANGGFFKHGDTLIQIDPRRYRSDVKQARAEVARATTQAATESALAGYAQKDWERLRQFNPSAGKASELTLRKPQLQQALAELQSAEAVLEKAEGDLDRTTIRAPYDGLIREKIADVGQYVNSGAQLARTYAIDKAEVRLPITQQNLPHLDIAKLRLGIPLDAQLTTTVGGYPLKWSAQITRTEGVLDPDSRVLYLVAEVDNPYKLADLQSSPLLIGTFVQAEIVGRSAGDLVKIPRHALQRGKSIWIVRDDLTLQSRDVNVVRTEGSYAYIDKGLEQGERYCITSIENPLPGMKVRLTN